jgi:hypothetical protein
MYTLNQISKHIVVLMSVEAVISWLESKIEGKEVQDIIRDKYLRSINK